MFLLQRTMVSPLGVDSFAFEAEGAGVVFDLPIGSADQAVPVSAKVSPRAQDISNLKASMKGPFHRRACMAAQEMRSRVITAHRRTPSVTR